MNNKDEEDFFNQIEQEKENMRLEKEAEFKKIPPSQFICRKCGQKTVNYHCKSIRRNDEPPVIFFTCSCGKQWSSRS